MVLHLLPRLSQPHLMGEVPASILSRLSLSKGVFVNAYPLVAVTADVNNNHPGLSNGDVRL